MEYKVELTTEEESVGVTTIDELDMIFEGKIPITIKKHNLYFAIDGDNLPRNEKYDPYFKYYPNCTSLSGDMKDQHVFRIYFNRAVYTKHRGKGITPTTMNGEEKKLLITALQMTISWKNEKMTLWEALKKDANNTMKSSLPDGFNIEDIEKYMYIEYDDIGIDLSPYIDNYSSNKDDTDDIKQYIFYNKLIPDRKSVV